MSTNMTKKLRRLPNGFGWIDKLPGTRRKPYRARVLVSKQLDMDVQKVRKKFKTIGYAETWTDAFELLQAYHSSPYGFEKRAMTVKEVYDARGRPTTSRSSRIRRKKATVRLFRFSSLSMV